jgi:hypothetical protein
VGWQPRQRLRGAPFTRPGTPSAVDSLEAEPAGARKLDEPVLADAIRTIGFECTRWGACCKAAEGCGDDEEADGGGEPHTAAVFPEEFRRVRETADSDWRDVARPTPDGLAHGPAGAEGEAFEWASGPTTVATVDVRAKPTDWVRSGPRRPAARLSDRSLQCGPPRQRGGKRPDGTPC